jgi:hypothetical protein
LDIDLKECISIQILYASPLIDSISHTFCYYLYIPVRLLTLQRKALDQLHKDAKTGKKGISKLALHFDTLEHGTEAFMQWLCSDDKMSASKNPIILKQFMDNKYTVLYDNTLNHDVIVETHDGVPFCKTCNTDDCGHVGFTILLEQKFENDGSLLD